MNAKDNEQEQSKIQALIQAGSEIVGSAAGATIGFLVAGPVGAIGGAALTPVLTRVSEEVGNRLTGRQKMRAGAVVTYAVWDIKKRLNRGETIRDDGFFEATSSRPKADEILEGVIIKAQNDHEERKAQYYANIFSTAAFDAKFTGDSLNHLLSIAGNLTYRQLCLMCLFSDPKPITLRNQDYFGIEDIPWETEEILAAAFDLYQKSLIICRLPNAQNEDSLLDFSGVNPQNMHHTSIGAHLHYLMQLSTLPSHDIQPLADLMQ